MTVLLGYFPKELLPPPDWMVARGIREIGSVSLCIAGGPEGWLETWRHNDWGFFASPQGARSVVPAGHEERYRTYGYALHPVEYWEGEGEPMEVVAPRVSPLPDSFTRVGWDAASRSGGRYFECSPLSCNLEAENRVTNEFCLFSSKEAAVELARSGDQFEPGPYCVLEVWRDRPLDGV